MKQVDQTPARLSRNLSGQPVEYEGISWKPVLLTAADVAGLLRTSRKAIYMMVERGQLPGVIHIGRRVLIREDALLDWLRQKSAPSLER
jgi:excisionase family DNA binding protein